MSAPAAADAPSPKRARVDSIDLLRGAVMILMALDHARDFFVVHHPQPLDLARTNAVLFGTRWITHFCAPVFSFLAGTAAFLSGARGKTRRALAWFLLTRGFWLILLDLTIVRVGFSGLAPVGIAFITLWALGGAMIVIAPLVWFLPARAVGAIGVAILIVHNAFDHVTGGALWKVLHVGGPVGHVLGIPVLVFYPLLPWIGVMAAGYGFGEIMQLPSEKRRRVLFSLGLGMIAGFVLLRGLNLYGDPHPWASQPRGAAFTVMSFLDCEKYPPSLAYFLMTMGPSILALALLDGVRVSRDHFVLVFGRVPLFYYLLHLFAVHIPAWIYFGHRYGARVLTIPPFSAPADYGLPLWAGYLDWIVAVVALYPVCRWYAGVKARSKNPWLSYL